MQVDASAMKLLLITFYRLQTNPKHEAESYTRTGKNKQQFTASNNLKTKYKNQNSNHRIKQLGKVRYHTMSVWFTNCCGLESIFVGYEIDCEQVCMISNQVTVNMPCVSSVNCSLWWPCVYSMVWSSKWSLEWIQAEMWQFLFFLNKFIRSQVVQTKNHYYAGAVLKNAYVFNCDQLWAWAEVVYALVLFSYVSGVEWKS